MQKNNLEEQNTIETQSNNEPAQNNLFITLEIGLAASVTWILIVALSRLLQLDSHPNLLGMQVGVAAMILESIWAVKDKKRRLNIIAMIIGTGLFVLTEYLRS